MPNSKNVLIIVHGMGEQHRNSSLVGVVRPILDLIRRRGDPNWDPHIDGTLAADQQASAEFEYGDKTWAFMEYWWAEEFAPPKRPRVALWIVRRLSAHFRSIWISVGHAWKDVFKSDDPWFARLYHVVAAPIYLVLTVLLAVLTPVLVLALLLLVSTSKIPGVPSIIKSIQSVLQTVAIDYLGDIYMYLEQPVQPSQIRGGFEKLLRDCSADANDRVVILAHSTGNMIVYDALAHMSAPGLDPGRHTENQAALKKIKAVIGIGSILPMAWDTGIVDPDKDPRFHRAIPPEIHWYHLWTRYDVGPAGPLTERLPKGPVTIEPNSLCDRRVSNSEDLLQDHTGYWDNQEQVHTLVLEEMGGLDPSNPFWRGADENTDPGSADRWRSRSPQTWSDFNMRRRLIAELAIVRLMSYMTLLVSFPYLIVFEERAQQMAEWLQLDHYGDWINWTWLENSTGDVSRLSSIGVAGLVALVLFVVVHVVVFQLLYKGMWWRWHFERMRSERDTEFRDWRDSDRRAWEAAGRPELWPQPDDAGVAPTP